MAGVQCQRNRSPSVISVSSDSEMSSSSSSLSSSSSSSLSSASTISSSETSNEVCAVDLPSEQQTEIIAVRKSRKIFADGPDQNLPYFIPNIADGQSDIPVRVINTIDDMDYGSDVFTYTAENLYKIPESRDTVSYCKCEGGNCDPRICNCRTKSNIRLKNGKIDPCQEKIDYHKSVLFECCEDCGCKGKCSNVFSNKSMPYRYEIFRRKHVGFGCRTLDRIRKGSFVCEFVGEVIAKRDATNRAVQSFMYTSYHHPTTEGKDSVIDPFFYGNAARFFNHSCNENLLPFRFFRAQRFIERPHIGFFAKRDILEGEELTIDYGLEWWAMNINNEFIQYCCCDSDYCVLPSPKRFQLTDAEMDKECEQLEKDKAAEEEEVGEEKSENTGRCEEVGEN
uniref:SET domain-containing protein n=1 Tax=Steinernema glaseri TaxID=37863 RepID=A0A1I8A908_9BILA